MMNMVASVDGAATVDGVSGGLGGPADKAVFAAIRAVADVIVVAANTVRTEAYGPPRTAPDRQSERRARGQASFPRIAVVSRSLDLDPTAAWLTDAPEPPLIYTVAHRHRGGDFQLDLTMRADVVEAGEETVRPAAVLADLYGRGARVVLVEGGPSWNGQLLAAGLIDEVNLTVGPLLVGGPAPRIAHGPAETHPTPMDLSHLWEQDGFLFARYQRLS